jgi:hypothetical protein
MLLEEVRISMAEWEALEEQIEDLRGQVESKG